jgi:hypothetical protein
MSASCSDEEYSSKECSGEFGLPVDPFDDKVSSFEENGSPGDFSSSSRSKKPQRHCIKSKEEQSRSLAKFARKHNMSVGINAIADQLKALQIKDNLTVDD